MRQATYEQNLGHFAPPPLTQVTFELGHAFGKLLTLESSKRVSTWTISSGAMQRVFDINLGVATTENEIQKVSPNYWVSNSGRLGHFPPKHHAL